MSALHRAVFAGRVAEVQYLLERRNCDPNVRDQNQRTPLIICSLSPDKDDMVKACAVILLIKGAKICLSDRLGKNALSWACVRNKVQLVQIFLSDYPNRFQFDLRKRDRDGNTALHLAAREGNTEIVDLLFGALEESELHAVVTERNIRGETPLHLAAKRGNSGVILALISVSSDALLSRRGAVDSRSAPKWAKAAIKMTGAVQINAGRPFSEHPLRKSASEKSSHGARIRRPQTVTSMVSKTKPCPTATSTDISTLFKISEMQISSAWRRPAQAPPTTTPSVVVGSDEKCKRPGSSRSKINGKGSSRRYSVASRGRPLRNSVVDNIVEEEPCRLQKQIPLVVVNELTVSADKEFSSRHYGMDAASQDPGNSSASLKRSSPLHNTTIPCLPESLKQGRNFLTPFGGAGMAFQFASRNSSLQSLASDITGLLTDSTPAFDRSETVPVITRDGCLAITQMRRSKSEPSLSTASDQQLTQTKLRDTQYGSKRAYNRVKGRPASRRHGQGKTQVFDTKDKGTGRRPTSKVTPFKIEVSHYGSTHQIGDTIAPSVPPTPTPSSRSYRRFTRPAREVEVTSQRRRKELEDKIRSIQTDIKRLEKRKKGRSYKPLLPEWMSVNQETTVDELVAAVLHDKKAGLSASQEILDCHSNDDKSWQSGMVPRSPQQSTAPGSSMDQHLSRSEPKCQTKERPQLPLKTRFSSDEKETPNSIHRSVPTLRVSQPAHAPSYKQSRSIYKQRSPVGGRPLVNSNRDSCLQPRVDLHTPRPQLHNCPCSWSTAAVPLLPNNNKRPNNQHFSCSGTAQCDTATKNSRRTFTITDKLK